MAQTNTRKNKHFIKGFGKKNGYDRWRFVFTGVSTVTGEEAPFFIEYYLLNPALSPRATVFKSDIHDPSDTSIRPSYIMIRAGKIGNNSIQINNFFTVEKMVINRKKRSMEIENNLMSETNLSGVLTMTPESVSKHPEYTSNAGSIKWNLQLEKKNTYGVGYASSCLFQIFNSLEMFWNVQGLKTLFSGSITVNNEEFSVTPASSFGYSDSYWGKGFPNPWVFLSSCNAVSQISGKRLTDTSFAVSGCYSRLFRIKKTQKLVIYASIEGREYEFNFTHFWKGSKVTYRCIEGEDCLHWLVSAQNRRNVLDIDIFCKSTEMILKSYESVSCASGNYQILSGGSGFGELRLYKKVGKNLETIEFAKIKNATCEYGEIDMDPMTV